MFKVIFGSGLTGFILGLSTCGLYSVFKKHQIEAENQSNKACDEFLKQHNAKFEVSDFDF